MDQSNNYGGSEYAPESSTDTIESSHISLEPGELAEITYTKINDEDKYLTSKPYRKTIRAKIIND